MKDFLRLCAMLAMVIIVGVAAVTESIDYFSVGHIKNIKVQTSQDVTYVTWQGTRNGDGYEVYIRNISTDSEYTFLGRVEEPQTNISGLVIGENYELKIRAYQKDKSTIIFGDFENFTFSNVVYQLE